MAECKVVPLCSKCHKALSEESISCGFCKKKFHTHCTDLNTDYQQMLRKRPKSFKWNCVNCESSSSVATTKEIGLPSNSFLNYPQVLQTSENVKAGAAENLVKIKRAKNVNHYESLQLPGISHLTYNVYNNGGAYGEPMRGWSSRDDASCNNALTSRLKRKCAADNKTVSMIICDGNEEQEYAIEDYFVSIQIEENNLQGLRSNKATIPLEKIFRTEDKQGVRTKRTILITADAGLGKTTLMKKLCYDWGTLEGKHYLCDFDFVINIPLKNVGTQSIESYTLNEIQSATDCLDLNDSLLAEWNVLYILDGYDETTETGKVRSFLEKHLARSPNHLSKGISTVILTSRPFAVEKFEKPQRVFDRRLSISGFSAESQKEYIEKILYDKAKYLKKAIDDNEFLSTASQSPLMLHLICCVYGKDDISEISSRTELYLQIFRLKLEIYARKHSRNAIYTRIQENEITDDELFVGLGEVAWKHLASKECITKDSLSAKFNGREFEFVIGLGILVAVPKQFKMKATAIYEFSHLTFAEFLSTIYVVDTIRKSKSTLGKEFTETLDICFFAGILREEILHLDEALFWIETYNFTATMMLEIKRGAHLGAQSWKSFCSHIKKISINCSRADEKLLLSTPLRELSEVNVSCVKAKTKTEVLKHKLLRHLRPHKLIIEMPFNILHFPFSETEDTFDVINMEGIMKELIKVANDMRSKIVTSIVWVQIIAVGISDVPNQKESSEVMKDIRKAPIGLLPNVLPNARGHHKHFDYTWKVGNIEIRYQVRSDDEETERLAVPIIAVNPEEYKEITKKPFLHDPALKVEFESCPFESTSDDLKMPRTFGHVGFRTFLERLNRWQEEKQLPPNENGDITGCNSASATDEAVETSHFTRSANRKKIFFVRRILEAILGSRSSKMLFKHDLSLDTHAL